MHARLHNISLLKILPFRILFGYVSNSLDFISIKSTLNTKNCESIKYMSTGKSLQRSMQSKILGAY